MLKVTSKLTSEYIIAQCNKCLNKSNYTTTHDEKKITFSENKKK